MTAMIFHPATRAALISAALVATGTIAAHPIPDVPVNTTFGASGDATVTIELDMRCLDPDPENARYIFFSELQRFTDEERAETRREAEALIDSLVEFEFTPGGKVEPEFTAEFFPKPGAELNQAQDVLFLRARAALQVPEGAEAYRLHAIDRGELTVYFLNEVGGVPVSRYQALFPGETSFWLDLNTGATHDTSSGRASDHNSGDPNPAPATATPASMFLSSWFFIVLAVLVAAGTSILLIRRTSARA